MSKRWLLLLTACAAFASMPVRAQVAQSSMGEPQHLWVGGEYLNFRPDWGIPRLPGIGIYADLGQYRRRYGLEGEARFLNFTKPNGLTEKSYLGGPYANIWHHGKFTGNVKFLVGGGLVTYTQDLGYGSYFAYVPGGSLEYRLARKLRARVDYEYEFMPSAPGAILPPGQSHGLTPQGVGAGVSYRVF